MKKIEEEGTTGLEEMNMRSVHFHCLALHKDHTEVLFELGMDFSFAKGPFRWCNNYCDFD